MTSTVLDVGLALLLISAAAVTLVGSAPPARSADRSNAALEAIATSTATVEYALAPAADPGDDRAFDRTRHDTLAGLAADATVATVEADGDTVRTTGGDFARSVHGTIADAIVPGKTQVLVVWRPYPGAHLESRMAIGPRPPERATVHAATATVPSGLPSTRPAAEDAARSGGFPEVASVVAAGIVAGLFPPERTRLALQGNDAERELVAAQYQQAADGYGVELPPALRERGDDDRRQRVRSGDVETANRRLTDAAADRIERDLRAEFDDPAAAARTVRIDRVRIAVRTWSR